MSIHQEGVPPCKRVAALGACVVLSALLLFPGRGTAESVTLTDGGSSATVDLTGGTGMNSWYVLGQNQLMQQWFWYRTDGGVAQPINSIGGLQYQATNNTLDAIYANNQLSIEIVYALTGTGAGSGNADMIENIYVKNLSGSSFTLNLYEYSYFNLLQSGNNSVSIFAATNGGFNNVWQTSGSTAIQETIANPNAAHAEAAFFNQTLNELNTQSGLVLNDHLTEGPGNVTWSFQWTQAIDPDQEFNVFKDKTLSIQTVPEPSTAAVIALGAGVLGLALRRKLS